MLKLSRRNFCHVSANLFLMVALVIVGISSSQAETLLIQRIDQGETNLPKRGTSMNEVTSKFGQPMAKHAPVGGGSKQHPLITRWDFEKFSVYFENSHVVDAVVKRASSTEEGPKPVR